MIDSRYAKGFKSAQRQIDAILKPLNDNNVFLRKAGDKLFFEQIAFYYAKAIGETLNLKKELIG